MTTRPGYDWTERNRRAKFVKDWRAKHGDLCVGYQRPAHLVDHATNPITADHVIPVGRGGDEGGELQALCNSCNSTKRDGRGRPGAANGHKPVMVAQQVTGYCGYPCLLPYPPHEHRYPVMPW